MSKIPKWRETKDGPLQMIINLEHRAKAEHVVLIISKILNDNGNPTKANVVRELRSAFYSYGLPDNWDNKIKQIDSNNYKKALDIFNEFFGAAFGINDLKLLNTITCSENAENENNDEKKSFLKKFKFF